MVQGIIDLETRNVKFEIVSYVLPLESCPVKTLGPGLLPCWSCIKVDLVVEELFDTKSLGIYPCHRRYQ